MKELVEKLGRFVTDDNYGMVIVSNEKMYWKPEDEVPIYQQPWNDGDITTLTPLQEINAFLIFERPEPEELKQEFEAVMAEREQAHPRLFGTRADFDNIIEIAKNDTYMQQMVDMIISSADNHLTRDLYTYKFDDNYRTYNTANGFNGRMQILGLAYLLTGNKKYSDRAWEEMQSICSFPDFNECHVIDAALYVGGLAFGYDWCYDALSEEQRSCIEDAVMEKGLKVLDRAFYRGLPSSASASTAQTSTQVTNYFTEWTSNYNTHVNVGIINAALAFAEVDPTFCFGTLNRAMRSVEYTMYGFLPSGTWAESNSYWTVTVTAMTKIIASLESIYGRDFGFGEYQGFEDTCYFYASMASPNGLIAYNDETGDSSNITNTVYAYFAKRYGQKDIGALRKLHILGAFKKISGAAIGLFDLLYYDPDIQTSDTELFPIMSYFHGLESVSFHEDYSDPDALFFTAYAGLSYYYHSHNDGGAFGFDMLGERWATDLGKENYNVGLTNSAIYRKRTEGHNTLTINNGEAYGQDVNAFAPLIKAESSEVGGYAVMDMTSYYASQANSVIRGFYIDDSFTAVTVQDEIDLKADSEVYWFMHTKADIDIIDETTALLSQNGKSIMLQMETDAAEFELSQMAAEPLPSSPQGGNQNPNVGYSKVAIRLNGNGKINLTVRMSPYMVESLHVTPIAEWTVPQGALQDKEDFSYKLMVDGREMSNASVIAVLDENAIPSWEIIPNDPTKIVEVIHDPKTVGEKVEVVVYNADRSKIMPSRILYSATSDALLDYYEQFAAKSITVTDEPEAENPGVNAIDGDIISRWCAKEPNAEGILDFGNVVTFDAFAAGFWKGNEREYTFELYTSEDGVSYTPIDTGTFVSSGTSDNYEIYRLETAYNARYIKFVNKGNTAEISPNNEFSNLTELLLLKFKD